MNCRYSSSQDGTLDLCPVPSDSFGPEDDPGAHGYYVAGRFGVLLSWQVAEGFYTIVNNDYTIEEPTAFHCQADEPVLQMIICLEGQARFLVSGVGEINLSSGQFNIFCQPSFQITGIFEGLTRVLVLYINIPIAAMQVLAPMYPVQCFIDNAYRGKPALLFEKPGWINSEFIAEYSWLQYSSRNDVQTSYLLDKQVKVFLLLLLEQKFYTGTIIIDPELQEAVRDAQHIIEAHLGKQLTIDAVADCVGLSEIDLSKYFRIMVGKNISEFITRARLCNAKMMLLETEKTIKEIAALSGYDYEKNFITAFQNTFGLGPSVFRKWT